MYNFVVCNGITNKIIGTGACSSKRDIQLQGTNVMEGTANPLTQKVIGNFGQYGIKPLGFLKIVDKTPKEIKADKPPEISVEKQSANITNEQWQEMQNKLDALEKKL